jgi:hypothetical protein
MRYGVIIAKSLAERKMLDIQTQMNSKPATARPTVIGPIGNG